jgi:LPS export ABC transporter protein LptC
MNFRLHRIFLVALLVMGSAILLFSCASEVKEDEGPLDAVKTEESENLTIIMSENGRKSYIFKAKLLEGYTLGRDPYREFRKGVSITTYQDDSLSTENATLVANYAIYYENRKLWEAKGDVVVTKHDGTRLYTQQLFWNSMTKRIYSNVDTKLVTDTDEIVGEGFESDEEMNEPRFRHWKGRLEVDTEQLQNDEAGNEGDENRANNAEEDKELKVAESKSSEPRPSEVKPAKESPRTESVEEKKIPLAPTNKLLPPKRPTPIKDRPQGKRTVGKPSAPKPMPQGGGEKKVLEPQELSLTPSKMK